MINNWTITKEKIIDYLNGYNNVIKTIWFELETIDGEKIVKVDGRINFDLLNFDNFIPYEQVTDEIRLTWIKNKYGDDYENYNIDQLSLI